MSLTRILFSWLYPIGLSLAFMNYVLPMAPFLAPWYFFVPTCGLLIWLFRGDLIDTFGVHTIFSYTMVKKSYEDLTPDQKARFDSNISGGSDEYKH